MQSDYMPGEDIIKRCKIKGFELLEYVRNGLKPYTKTGRIFNCPDKYNLKMRLNNINKGISKLEHPSFPRNLSYWDEVRTEGRGEILLHQLKQSKFIASKKIELLDKKNGDNSWSWYYFDFPDSEEESEKIINDIVDSNFLKDDVSKIIASKKRNSLYNQNYKHSFFHKGEFWDVRFGEKSVNLKDLKRLRYLIHLLDNPNQYFYSHELINLVKGEPNQYQEDLNDASLVEEGLSITELHIESLSQKELKDLENPVYKIWDDLMRAKESDSTKRISDAREEFEKLTKYLFNEYGIIVISSDQGPRFKLLTRLSKDAEKARINVKKNISNSIKDIKRHLPSLATHLDNHIKTGMKCSYHLDPENPLEWHIRW